MLFAINWKSISPWREYKSTCWIRNICRREDSPVQGQDSRNISSYFEWIDVVTISPKTTLIPHSHNIHEGIYVLDGLGSLQTANEKVELTRGSTAYLKPDLIHSISNKLADQALSYISVAIIDSQEPNKDVNIYEYPKYEGEIMSDKKSSEKSIIPSFNWRFKDPDWSGHENTIWWYSMISREHSPFEAIGMQIIPPGPNDLHCHDYEIFYYIEQGEGFMRVAHESREVKEGDFIYVPPHAPHSAQSKYFDLQLNTLCIAHPVPAGIKTTTYSVGDGAPVKSL